MLIAIICVSPLSLGRRSILVLRYAVHVMIYHLLSSLKRTISLWCLCTTHGFLTEMNFDNARYLGTITLVDILDVCSQDLHRKWEPKRRHYRFSNRVVANFVHKRHIEMFLCCM